MQGAWNSYLLSFFPIPQLRLHVFALDMSSLVISWSLIIADKCQWQIEDCSQSLEDKWSIIGMPLICSPRKGNHHLFLHKHGRSDRCKTICAYFQGQFSSQVCVDRHQRLKNFKSFIRVWNDIKIPLFNPCSSEPTPIYCFNHCWSRMVMRNRRKTPKGCEPTLNCWRRMAMWPAEELEQNHLQVRIGANLYACKPLVSRSATGWQWWELNEVTSALGITSRKMGKNTFF